jgi:hypothetical protein
VEETPAGKQQELEAITSPDKNSGRQMDFSRKGAERILRLPNRLEEPCRLMKCAILVIWRGGVVCFCVSNM